MGAIIVTGIKRPNGGAISIIGKILAALRHAASNANYENLQLMYKIK